MSPNVTLAEWLRSHIVMGKCDIDVTQRIIVRVTLNILVVSIAIAGGFYQIYLKPLLHTLGYSPTRIIEPRGNQDCKTIPVLNACESAQFYLFSEFSRAKKLTFFFSFVRNCTPPIYWCNLPCLFFPLQSVPLDSCYRFFERNRRIQWGLRCNVWPCHRWSLPPDDSRFQQWTGSLSSWHGCCTFILQPPGIVYLLGQSSYPSWRS